MHGSTCDETDTDSEQILESSINEKTKSFDVGKFISPYIGLTQQKLLKVEMYLAKYLPKEQTQHAMDILNGFRVGANNQEKKAALVSIL